MSNFETQEKNWNWLMANLSKDEIRVLYHEAYTILKNREDASDALREALFIGATKCHQLKKKERLFQWMYTIIRNAAYKMHNKNQMQNVLIQAKLSFEKTSFSESAEAHLMNTFEKEQLRRAIENLHSPGKEILKMHIFHKMNFRAIAKKLNLNYSTTRSVYHRVLMKLKEELEENQNA